MSKFLSKYWLLIRMFSICAAISKVLYVVAAQIFIAPNIFNPDLSENGMRMMRLRADLIGMLPAVIFIIGGAYYFFATSKRKEYKKATLYGAVILIIFGLLTLIW